MIKPQLALHLYKELDKKRTTVREDTFAIFEKYDGWFGMKEVSGICGELSEVCMISSRAGRVIPSVRDLSSSIGCLEHNMDWTVKGTILFEILVHGFPEFKDLNGILNRSKGDCEAKGAYLMVHDFIPHDGVEMGIEIRHKIASEYVETLGHDRVMIAPILDYGNTVAVQNAAEGIWNRGGEGVIGKRVGAGYSEGKRNKDIIKVKEEVTLDLLVVDIEEGEGKYEGTTGKLIVRNKAGQLNPVSGMSDAERGSWWDFPNLIKGYIVEVKAMKVLANGSLREGRFKAIRHDKDVSEID